MAESLPGSTTALREELEREKAVSADLFAATTRLGEALAAANARAEKAEAEAEAQHARWCNEVVDHCPHPAEEGVCCSECLAAALKALAAARLECEAQDKSATRWAHMYNDLFHSLEPWLRKRRSFLEHEIARGDAFLAAGPRDRWEAESGSAWNVNATGWRSMLPDYRSELTTIRAALAAPGDGEEGK